MKERLCGKVAVETIAWAGKQLPSCEEHAAEIRNVGNAIGVCSEGVPNSDSTVTCIQKVSDEPPEGGGLHEPGPGLNVIHSGPGSFGS